MLNDLRIAEKLGRLLNINEYSSVLITLGTMKPDCLPWNQARRARAHFGIQESKSHSICGKACWMSGGCFARVCGNPNNTQSRQPSLRACEPRSAIIVQLLHKKRKKSKVSNITGSVLATDASPQGRLRDKTGRGDEGSKTAQQCY
jgi:hypothetical protein